MTKKRFIAIVSLVVALSVILTGCGGTTNSNQETQKDEPDVQEKKEEIGVEIKDLLDSYETFANEYVEFMKSYKSSDLSQLSKYTEMISKSAEFLQKVQNVDQKQLNTAELIYYTEVVERVSKKLLEAIPAN